MLGVGKTTLLREVIRHLALRSETKVVVDSSADVTGTGQVEHWVTQPERRIRVSEKKSPAELNRPADANHNPMVIGLNKIGHRGDDSTVDRGVGMVATCHGETITSVMNT